MRELAREKVARAEALAASARQRLERGDADDVADLLDDLEAVRGLEADLEAYIDYATLAAADGERTL
jgi:hypothetical protein